MRLSSIDQFLLQPPATKELHGVARFFTEFWYFGIKELRACLFVGLFFASILIVPKAGLFGLARYDVLFIVALLIQAGMVWSRLETIDELKAITLFHLIGFALEVFKTSTSIQSWTYPEPGYSKLWGVPLFSGFMYASIGSYIIQAWRLFDLRVRHHPPYWMAALIGSLIYLNFFTHHYIGDIRWYLAACALGLYARSSVVFRPLDRDRSMPLLLAFVLIGFFIWLAENMGTFFGIWRYPNQIGAWSTVHLGKWSSWSLLVIMTFTIVAHLKHIKRHIHIAQD
ncbi:MAG: DUF817 domain-containing protein [Burkholderiales bacterium]|nr:DUF817 domain-containing protein [Burkholderiales bacterium]